MATHAFDGTARQENIYHLPDPPPSPSANVPPVPAKRSNSVRSPHHNGSSHGGPASPPPRTPNQRNPPPPVAVRRDHTYESTPGTSSNHPRLQTTLPEKQSQQNPPKPSQRPHRSPSLGTGSRNSSTSEPLPTKFPKLQNKPRTRSSTANSSSSRAKNHQQTQPAEDEEGISLQELVKRYSQSFPLRIRVLRGFCGQTSRLTISTQDVYNIHFMKYTTVVAMKDSHGNPYSIPLNSSVEFGIVYDPNERRDEALDGLKFEGVADILSLAHPPKVICATQQWFGDDARVAVQQNELFIIKQVLKPKFKGKKGLKVFSMLSKTDRFLPEDCVGHFTTNPYVVRLHLPEMMEHLSAPFPCQACLYLDEGIYQNPDMESQIQDLPDALLTKIITLCHCMTETSLIASSVLQGKPHPYEYRNNGSISEDNVLFDIPVDETLDEIEVAVIESNDSKETEQLYDSTRTIYEKFNPRKVRTCKDTGSEQSFTAQSLFYAAVRQGCETVGVELSTPSVIYEHITPILPGAKPVSKKVPEASALIPQPSSPKIVAGAAEASGCIKPKSTSSPLMKRSGVSEQKNGPSPLVPRDEKAHEMLDTSSDYETISFSDEGSNPDVEYLRTVMATQEKRITALEAASKEHSRVRGEIAEIKSSQRELEKKVRLLASQVQQSSSSVGVSVPPAGPSGDGSIEEENKRFLKSMDNVQVQSLLTAMDLTQYRETFTREHVTGEILLELDDGDLQSELGMASKIHRLRVLKVIKGRHSAQSILSGVDPYARCGQ